MAKKPDAFVHPVNVRHFQKRTTGERAADAVVSSVGSWRFLIIQTIIVVGWIIVNAKILIPTYVLSHPPDPFPFILLNLAFSTQAAYATPLILMSGNRQAAKDRALAEHDFAVNQESFRLLTAIARKVEADIGDIKEDLVPKRRIRSRVNKKKEV